MDEEGRRLMGRRYGVIWPQGRKSRPKPKAFIRDRNHVAVPLMVIGRCEALTARRSRCTRDAFRWAFEVTTDRQNITHRACCRLHYLKKRESPVRDHGGFGVIEWWPRNA
jgi:hypothetical protein